MSGNVAFYRKRPDGIDLAVRLTPKSSSDTVEGISIAADGRAYLSARVRAVPDKGAANSALEKLLADRFHLPKRSVRVISGATSRLKTVRLSGEPDGLCESLDALPPATKS